MSQLELFHELEDKGDKELVINGHVYDGSPLAIVCPMCGSGIWYLEPVGGSHYSIKPYQTGDSTGIHIVIGAMGMGNTLCHHKWEEVRDYLTMYTCGSFFHIDVDREWPLLAEELVVDETNHFVGSTI